MAAIPESRRETSLDGNGVPSLRVMKFGGTSLGDSTCIARAVGIIQAASRESNVVVVVSAMAGVTNRLLEAATLAEAGEIDGARSVLRELRIQHENAVNALIHSAGARREIGRKMDELFQQAERLCDGTMLVRELTLRTRDAVSGLGERLSAPLVAAALSEGAVTSQSVEASMLVVTDSYHGAAEPQISETRERCERHLIPLLRKGIVPVVTGFIGATGDGVLTTLGRGGSDYSATILGAVLQADEIIIWTDVDGLMTADPRLVDDACTVTEVSYREAAELAYFGAKVLHPKTLRPLVESDVPVWIRNTFAPEQPGTKITPNPRTNEGVKALAAVENASFIRVGGPGMASMTDVLGRTLATAAAVRADVLMISQSSSQHDICMVVASAIAKRVAEALRREFSIDLAHEPEEHITVDSTVAIIAIVGHSLGEMSVVIGRTFGELSRENIKVIAIAQGSSECAMSFVVEQKHMQAALQAVHREFQLGTMHSGDLPSKTPGAQPAKWLNSYARSCANAD